MKKATVLGALASASILAASFAAQAAEWHKGPPALRFDGKPVAAARAYLGGHAANLRIDGIDFEQQNVLALRAMSTVRYQQRYGGLPVFGKTTAVRVGPGGVIQAAAVDVARGLTVSTTPSVDDAQARDAVAAVLGHVLSPQQARLELGVLPYESVGGILVWHVDVMLSHGMHRFVVDAQTGAVIRDYSLAHDARGRIYEINPSLTPTLVEVDLTNLDPATASLSGFDGALRAYGYTSGDLQYSEIQTTQTGPSSGEDFLFDPNAQVTSLDDPFGEVMAYHHASRMRNYFEETFALDMSSSAYSLAVVSSYAANADYIQNAFYSPGYSGSGYPGNARNIICLGRGYSEDFAYDSDVLLHEFTHYISNNAMNYTDEGFYDEYGSTFMGGAINEGTADYFSSTVNNNPIVGEYALGYDARDLAADVGKCPDSVIGESHEDGKLIGTTGWALRQAFGAEVADQLVWGALSFLGASASLGDFGQGVVQTATDLGLDDTQMSTVESILSYRGLDDCGRSLELKGNPRSTFLMGLDLLGQMMGGSCSDVKNYGISMSSIFQFVYTPDQDDLGAEFAIQLETAMGGGSLDWNVYIRRNEMVTFDPGSYYVEPKVLEYDYAYEGLTNNHLSVVLDKDSVPAFDKDTSYYLVMWHQNCSTNYATVGAIGVKDLPMDAGTDGPVEHDAAAPDAGGYEAGVVDGGTSDAEGPVTDLAADLQPGGGCGCRTTGGSTPTNPLAGGMLGLLAALVMRRRRH